MFLGAYHFDGPTDDLVAAYERMMAGYPPDAILLHVCTRGADGIVVLDACPSREVFTQFSTSPEFQGACAAAGLPRPRVEPLGDVHTLRTAP